MTNDVEVPCALRVLSLAWQLKRCVGKEVMVPVSHALARLGPGVQMLEFDTQNRALDAFHSVIVSDLVVIITLRGTVLAQSSSPGCKCGIIRNQGSAFSVGP